jgi:hypothetical protein
LVIEKRCLLVAAAAVSACLALASPARAQVQVSAIGGLNVASLDADADDFTAPDSKIGLVGGAAVTVPVTPRLTIRPEVLYSQQGGSGTSNGDDVTDVTFGGGLIEIPMLAQFNFGGNLRPFVLAGPTFGFIATAKETSDTLPDNDIGDEVTAWDAGLMFGAGVMIKDRFGVEFRYKLGLKDVALDDSDDVRTRVLSFMVSVSLFRL